MADITEFNIGQGETFRILMHMTDSETGGPLDLTDYTFSGQVRENYSTSKVAATLEVDVALPPASGSVFVGLSPQATMQLTQRKYVYDVNMMDPINNVTRRVLEGYLIVRPTATR